MADTYGHRWESSYGTTPNKAWIDGLAGVTPQMMARGLSELVDDARFKTWPPNVFEFRGLCEFNDYGLPIADDAYQQAVNWGRLSVEEKHPAVLFMLRSMPDQFNWLRTDYEKARKRFDAEWSKAIEHVASGGYLPEIPKEITEQTGTKTEAGSANGRMAMMAALYGK